jgi:mannose-6-phosphate isomerase-like protein (cupin superfamily)
MSFATKRLGELPDATAPDGSEVRVLCSTSRGSLAHFTLPLHAVSKAMAHRTVEEVWYFVSGRGQMWRRSHDYEEIVDVEPGVAITIPVGTYFQFRSLSHEPLTAVGTTMPRGRARARRLPSMGSGIQLFDGFKRTSGERCRCPDAVWSEGSEGSVSCRVINPLRRTATFRASTSPKLSQTVGG